MYSQLFINQFIEMRAKRVSIEKAFRQLRISRATAVRWEHRYKAQIAELRAVHFEAVCERVGLNYEQEVTYATEQLNRIRAELKKRKVEHVSTEFLYNAEVTAFARAQKLWRMAELPDTPPEPEQPEPGEPVTPPQDTPPQNEHLLSTFRHQNGGEGAQNHTEAPTQPSAEASNRPPAQTGTKESDGNATINCNCTGIAAGYAKT